MILKGLYGVHGVGLFKKESQTCIPVFHCSFVIQLYLVRWFHTARKNNYALQLCSVGVLRLICVSTGGCLQVPFVAALVYCGLVWLNATESLVAGGCVWLFVVHCAPGACNV